nr:hypothetical protein [uncultured bacterium]
MENTTDMRVAVDDALRASYRRVTRCQSRRGDKFWLKRVERSSPFLWMVKGLPREAFERDRRSHRLLWSWGAPVPAILLEGEDFFAVEDAGASLTRFCKSTFVRAAEKEKACRTAGQALARLHSAGLCHGRPAFRDMCWDGYRIRFIDFEYFVPARAGWLRKARDVCIAVLSAICQGVAGPRYACLLLSAYYAAWGGQADYVIEPLRERSSMRAG